MRVLIIDDSAVMRKTVEAALRHSGLQLDGVLQAADGLEGIAAIERFDLQGESLDLILCDVHMPRLDGIGFLLHKSQCSLARGVPVVMITADASDPHLLHAIAAGAQGYIAKPFSREQIQATRISVLSHAGNTPADPVADDGNTQTMKRGPS